MKNIPLSVTATTRLPMIPINTNHQSPTSIPIKPTQHHLMWKILPNQPRIDQRRLGMIPRCWKRQQRHRLLSSSTMHMHMYMHNVMPMQLWKNNQPKADHDEVSSSVTWMTVHSSSKMAPWVTVLRRVHRRIRRSRRHHLMSDHLLQPLLTWELLLRRRLPSAREKQRRLILLPQSQ